MNPVMKYVTRNHFLFNLKDFDEIIEEVAYSGRCYACGDLIVGSEDWSQKKSVDHHIFIDCKKYSFSVAYINDIVDKLFE